MAQKTFVFPGFESSVDYTAINDEGMSEPFRKESITLAELNKELEEELFESSDGSQGTCCVPLLDHRRQLVRFLGFTASSQLQWRSFITITRSKNDTSFSMGVVYSS